MPTSFSHIVLRLFTFPLLLLQSLQNPKILLLLLLSLLPYYLLLNILLQILSYPGVVELATQLLILENILWLPLCRINKFGLNTPPSKTVAIPSWLFRLALQVPLVSSGPRKIIVKFYSVWTPFSIPFLRSTKTRKEQKLALGSRLIS